MYLQTEMFISTFMGASLLNVSFIQSVIDYIEKHNFSPLISLDVDKYGHSYRIDHVGNNSFERV